MTAYTPDQSRIELLLDQLEERQRYDDHVIYQADVMPTTQAVDNAFEPAIVEPTTNFFNPDGPVAELPSFTTIIDTPTKAFGIKDYYQGSDAAEIFELRDYHLFSNPINRTVVLAEGGDDIVHGTRVMDQVSGGDGHDTVYGWFGDDQIQGGNGNDMLYGQQGNDGILGDNGNDYIDGGEGNDYLDGGTGNDLMFGASGDDRMWGGDGHDSMYAGEGRDILSGGNGNDVLDGGQGNDVLTGGSGADTFVFSGGMDVVKDFNWFEGDRINLAGFQGTVSVKEYVDASGTVHTAVSKSADNFMVFEDKSGLEIVEGLKGNEGLNVVASNFNLPGTMNSLPQDSSESEDLISSMIVADSLAF
ncbi:calcium-binding protein [Synechococcus sp. CC9311]|uniref:calcium-binding protein n=1 Tax=Synechococcus sp. (strain CC9311) TaxID=64471 RepID=UPI000674AD06|nr:calcium-binding protein [Synechococcus sp. CC9311]